MKRPVVAVVAAAGIAALVAGARAEVASVPSNAPIIDLPETPAQLALGDGWKAEENPALPAGADVVGPARVVAFYREARKDALALIVLRFDAPNPRAWREKTRAAYLEEIESGLYAACAGEGSGCQGIKRVKRATSTSEAVPVMDLHTKDAAGTQRLYRFLFFRTYAILAAVELPATAPAARRGKRGKPVAASAAVVARAKRALASFTVQANWQR